MTIRWKGTNHHPTHDAVSVGAAKALAQAYIAKFPAGHGTACECVASGGKVAPEDCSYICVYDPDGNEVARFGRQFRAVQADDGSIAVWKVPSTQTQDRQSCRDHSERLARLNQQHAEYYRRSDVEV
jgi:hypothetical protein